MTSKHIDGLPLDYTDPDGVHVMCACGHRVTGAEIGDQIALCPNCTMLASPGTSVTVAYPDRLPNRYRARWA